MAFLDPDRAKLVRRSCNGPARICDAAGTGKTVVSLHHDAYLARSTRGRVRFTGYLKTLPHALESLLERSAPRHGQSRRLRGRPRGRHAPAERNAIRASSQLPSSRLTA